MSFPDYEQKCDDHKSLLILVKCINGRRSSSQLTSKTFGKLYERIANVDELCIEDAQGMGCRRLIKLRFKRNEYENENNDWGDFQCHRKLVGLIAIGKYNGDESDLDDIYGQYQNAVDKYSSTLYDSRCLLFNVKSSEPAGLSPKSTSTNETNGDTIDESHMVTSRSEEHSDDLGSQKSSNSTLRSCNDIRHPLMNDCDAGVDSSSRNSKSSKNLTQFIFYNCVNNEIDINAFAEQLEKDVKDLISSLFWVLESKRLDRSYEKSDKIPLIMAPFETKALVGLDMDSKVFKKKCSGRMRKYMGDLSLLAGLPSEALIHYGNSIDTLRSASDWLWLASALEGQCVASVALLFPQTMRRKSSLQRNSSLPPSKFRQLQEESQNPNKSRKFARKFLLSSPGSNRSLPTSDPIVAKALGKFLLSSIDEVYERYKEGCCYYAKYRNASVIELECSFKAAKLLTHHEKYLYASEFIQNAVFICFNQSHDEQIKRLSIIAELYSDIGYNRKAAFYKRFAALKAISVNMNKPNWEQCYHLLLPALDGYQLTLDPLEYDRRIKQRSVGWTGIHLQLLQELVTTAKRMNSEQIAIRHLSFLLHALFEHLTPNQRREFAKQLETLSANCGEGAPVPLTLESGITIPSVNLTKFPFVVSFTVQNLSPQLRPVKLKSKHRDSISSSPASPFIFTPLQLSRPSSSRRRSLNSPSSQPLDFKWSEGETCQVLLQVYNYLPIELQVSYMSLMTDGIAFETYPTSLTLPPESGPFPVQLTGTPRGNGKLDILGYTTHVLGVKNNCKLKDLTNAKKRKFPNMYTIEVIPPLPCLDISCAELPKSNKISVSPSKDSPPVVSSVCCSLFAGESITYSLTFTNNSVNNELIEILSVTLQSKVSNDEQLITWDDEVLQNNLPLPPNESFNFDITIHGFFDFVKRIEKRKLSKSRLNTSGMSTPQHSSYGSPVHVKKNQQNMLGTALANFISDLQNGGNLSAAVKSKQSSEPSIIANFDEFPSKIVELLLHIEYSGGAGLAAGYCRKCALAVQIEVLPSLLITQWDVLPAEVHDNCYLVFDVLNATNHEMELFYASNKSILIESKETCRIPVPVERCPLIDTDESGDHSSFTGSRDALHSRCKSYLDNQVHLKWLLLASSERSGTASISDIPWTSSMLDAILMSSVRWDVKINEQEFRPEDERVYKIGEVIAINVSIANCSCNALKSLCLWIQCYQDYQNGHRNYRLDMKRAILGCDKVYIEEIESKAKYTHDCCFMFCYSGAYKMDIQCSGFDSINQRDREKYPFKTETIGAETTGSHASLWKFSPTIEFTIVE